MSPLLLLTLVSPVFATLTTNWHASNPLAYQTCAAGPGVVFAGITGASNEVEGYTTKDGTPKWTWSPPGGSSLYTELVTPKVAGGAAFALDIMRDGQNITVDVSRLEATTGKADWSIRMADTSGGATTTLEVSRNGKVLAAAVAELVANETKVGKCKLVVFDATATDSKKAQIGSYEATDHTKYPSMCNVVALSSDGTFAAMYASQQIIVWDVQAAKVRWTSPVLGYSEQDLAISKNGEYLAIGFEALSVYKWDATKSVYDSYITEEHTVGDAWVMGKQAFSGDGTALAVGWYDASGYAQNRIVLYNMASTTPVWTYNFPGEPVLHQDIVSGIAMDEGGKHFVVGSWGDGSPKSNPTVNVFSAAQATGPVASFSTPGSVFGVDFSDVDGTVCASGKHVHANVMGGGGDAYSFTFAA